MRYRWTRRSRYILSAHKTWNSCCLRGSCSRSSSTCVWTRVMKARRTKTQKSHCLSSTNRIVDQVKSESEVLVTTLYQISGSCPSESRARFSFYRKILVEAAFPCVPQTGVVSYVFVEALTACYWGTSKSKMQ